MRTKATAAVCLTAVLLVFLSGCGRGEGGNGGVDLASAKPGELTEEQIYRLPDPKQFVYELDYYARRDLASEEYPSAEAREWLKEERHGTFEAAKDDLKTLTEEFYSAGAAKVYVTGITTIKPEDFGRKPANEEEAKGVDLSDVLVIELPDDPAKRKTVIALAAKFLDEWFGEVYDTEDYGQKHIQISFD
jgi:hypothetical protein